jgi:glutamate formiminotransferase/formiminotetrahydrofolate cyclodeaminase
VYLYEAAATRPERQNLENLRRGQYEGLKHEIGSNPDRQPDFGPLRLGKAGATAIGARPFLVAYNVYLNTPDVDIAKKVARAVRHSSGGLRYVKALGLLVAGRAQVSMNLTDFAKTPMHRVVEMVRREAARYGAHIVSSEVIGLIPQAALTDAAQWYLQLDGLQDEQILEHKLALLEQLPSAAESSTTFLDALAAGTATPGGGAAAAYSGAMAAALVMMVARLTIGNKRYAAVVAQMEEVRSEAEKLRAVLTASVAADCTAFDAVMQAYKLPRDYNVESATRDTAIEQALHGATAVPLQVARDAARVLELAASVAEKGNLNAVGEAGSAANLAFAAVRTAALNVRINAAAVKDREGAQRWLEEIAALEDKASAMAETIRHIVGNRLVPGT